MAKKTGLGTRHFGGKLYSLWKMVGYKQDAIELKERLRARGYEARIIPTTTGTRRYAVYARKR